jgi:hypothetical protein
VKPIALIHQGVNVLPFLWELQAHPELWDTNKARTAPEWSPHHGLSDIWLRYAPPGVDGSQPHQSQWYDSPLTPLAKQLVYPLMSMVQGDELGGVLLTKIPAGKECKPHTDPGWHARYYQKYAIQIQSAPGQSFNFEDAQLVSRPGDVFWFDNSFTHWVPNPTAHDRITMIVCIKTGRKGP